MKRHEPVSRYENDEPEVETREDPFHPFHLLRHPTPTLHLRNHQQHFGKNNT